MTATESNNRIRVTMKTSRGDIALHLFAEEAPVTVANFLNLALRGYYNAVTFHRVIAGFMMQGGDPTGRGTGGPGYVFEDEFRSDLSFDRPGIVAMANRGPSTNGSQFFITYAATPHLNGRHTVFGEVIEGFSVATSIKQGDVIQSVEVQDSPEQLFAEQAENLARWNAILQD